MNEVSDNLSVLVVGNIDPWLMTGHKLPKISNTEFCTYDDLTAEFLLDRQPDIILAPLVTAYFDMLDLAIRLDQLNYEGRIRAITPPLPDPDLVLHEIRFECPALDFDLIEVRLGNKLRSV
ncbi:MAG: hypothetical protein L3J30_06190 [Marinosulfonomonas sp.]|nr:hypothetical protein [Marinosulfonomonas sp.]